MKTVVRRCHLEKVCENTSKAPLLNGSIHQQRGMNTWENGSFTQDAEKSRWRISKECRKESPASSQKMLPVCLIHRHSGTEESCAGGGRGHREVGGCIVSPHFHLTPKQSMKSYNHYLIARNEIQLKSSKAESSSFRELPTVNKAFKWWKNNRGEVLPAHLHSFISADWIHVDS